MTKADGAEHRTVGGRRSGHEILLGCSLFRPGEAKASGVFEAHQASFPMLGLQQQRTHPKPISPVHKRYAHRNGLRTAEASLPLAEAPARRWCLHTVA